MNYKYGGYVQMTEAGYEDGTNREHERLYSEVVADEPGYFYIYLSNDGTEGGEAFFDDFTILTLESYIVQQTDYYPYGLIARKFVRENERETKELFQGKTYDELTGWYDFHARQYDAALGRWFGVDAYTHSMRDVSPFNPMANNPVMFVDPDGNAPITLAALGIAMLKGALIGGAGYTASVGFSKGGFDNWQWGQLATSMGMGAISGMATAGIGSMMGAVGSQGFAGEIGRAMLHGQANLMIGSAFGQSPSFTMYASGAFGSLTGSSLPNAGSLGQIGGSALAGGVASKMFGGDFWRGAAVGATVAGLNHMANHAVESLLLKHYIRGLHGVADMDAESKYRENNAHIADQIKEKYFKGYSLKGRGLKSRSFESGMYDGEEIHLFLLKNDVTLDSYDKYKNLVEFGLNRFWKGGPTIALRQGTLDYFFASFKSIQARDNFFIKHYDNRFFRRYNEFVNRFGGK